MRATGAKAVPAKTKAPVKTKKAKKSTKDFTDEDDVRASQEATASESDYIKIKEGERAPIYFMGSEFSDGFEHWVHLGGNTTRIACAGGVDGNGYAADECPLCKVAQDHYNSSKKLATAGKTAAAKREKDLGNDVRAKYAMYFIAAKGERNVVKLQGKEKKFKIEFDNAQLGYLAMTKNQRDTFQACKSKFDYITSNSDLFNRYIVMDKQKRGDDAYATIEFTPATKPTARPELDIPDTMDLDSLFEVDLPEIKKLAKAYLSGESDDDSDDSGVDLEDDDDESSDDDDLSDELDSDDDEIDDDDAKVEEEEDEEPVAKKRGRPAAKKASAKKGRKAVEDDDDPVEDDSDEAEEVSDEDEVEADSDDDFLGAITDDFEDDDPEEDAPKSKKGAKSAPAKAVAKKTTVIGKKGKSAAETAAPKRGRPAAGKTPPMPASAKKRLTGKR